MTTATNKIFNDPVYGFVSIPYGIVFNLIEHPYFQRLRRIKQLGLTHYVYPGALHTRFHHALGALHLMTQAVEVLRSKDVEITEAEAEAAAEPETEPEASETVVPFAFNSDATSEAAGDAVEAIAAPEAETETTPSAASVPSQPATGAAASFEAMSFSRASFNGRPPRPRAKRDATASRTTTKCARIGATL